MIEWIALATIASAVGAAPVVAARVALGQRRRYRAHLADLAKRTGLAMSAPDLFGAGVNLTGRLDGVDVLVERAQGAEAGSGLWLALDAASSMPLDLTILAPDPEATRTRIGDPVFDTEVALSATEPIALALPPALRAETLRRVRDESTRVDAGHVRRRIRMGAPDATLAALKDLAGYARRLVLDDIPAAIGAKIEEEPATATRLASMRCLVREWPRNRATHDALDRVARTDPDPVLRLTAALCLPEFAPERARVAPVNEVVHALLYSGALAPRMLECLKAAGAAEEPILADLATRHAQWHEEDVLRAAIERLGEIGDEKTVGRLLAIKSPHALANAASMAIARIQARLPGASAGQLTIAADDAAGALSVAAQGGELSLPKKA